MTNPAPVLAKKTVSATIGGIASRAPISTSSKLVKKPTTVVAKKPTTAATKKPSAKPAAPKKTIVRTTVKKTAEPVAISASGRPQRPAAAKFLNDLATHRKALSDYRSAMALYKENVAKGVPAKKPKEPDVPKQFKDALRSEETEDDEESTDEEFEEEDDDEDDDDDAFEDDEDDE